MALDDAIPTKEIREKLDNLKDYMPGQSEFIYELGKYFAQRLGNPEIVPEGFNLEYQLMLYDLQEGVDGYTRKPVPSSLGRLPAMTYLLLEMRLPAIAKAVCPKDFADKVGELYKKVRELVKEM